MGATCFSWASPDKLHTRMRKIVDRIFMELPL
jgi:hypothetical protein